MSDAYKKALGIVSPSEEWLGVNRPKVKCPHCGYEMPLTYDPQKAHCEGIFVRCKGRNCKLIFEIKINTK